MSLHGSSVSFVQDGLGASQPQIPRKLHFALLSKRNSPTFHHFCQISLLYNQLRHIRHTLTQHLISSDFDIPHHINVVIAIYETTRRFSRDWRYEELGSIINMVPFATMWPS